MAQPKNRIHSDVINARKAHGRTQLFEACKKEKYDDVKKLLENNPLIDICLKDDSGLSPLEYAVKRNRLECAGLIKDEAYRRSKEKKKKNVFLKTLQEELEKPEDTSFDEDLFCLAIETLPKAANKYLNRCVVDVKEIDDNYDYEFKDLDKVFGLESVKKSALASVLNESILPSQMDEKVDCLRHIAFKRVLDIKWELFGARKYYQQLLLYILMLMAITNDMFSTNVYRSATQLFNESHSFSKWPKEMNDIWVGLTFSVWVYTLTFCIIAFVHLRHLKPHLFLKLTRWMYDGKYQLDPNFTIPRAADYKSKAQFWLLRQTVLWTSLIAIPLLCFMKYVMPYLCPIVVYYIIHFNFYFTFVVLWFCALYFLLQEMQELLGEDPWIYEEIQDATRLGKFFWTFILIFVLPFFTPFLSSYRKYYASFANKLQLVTYLVILVPYPISQWTEVFGEDSHVYYYICAFITISLWMLSLQFLEVNKTAGYLLPILYDVVWDAKNFLIFYGVFQCGIACAFYFVMPSSSDAYKSLWASFVSTYFVMFGEIGFDEFTEENESGENIMSDAMTTFAFVLRMFQCAVMSILLLNLLLAMMNKTVDRNWEKLQSRALYSYARAVLRFEIMLGLNKDERKKMMEISLPHQPSQLNPIFHERVSKQELAELGFKLNNPTEAKSLTEQVAELSAKNEKLEKDMDKITKQMACQLQDMKMLMQSQLEQILRITEELSC